MRCLSPKGEAFAQGGATDALLLADLYRRTGQFDHVETVCAEGLALNPEALIRSLFQAQRQLAQARDTKRYTVAQAQKLVAGPGQQQ